VSLSYKKISEEIISEVGFAGMDIGKL